jgi:hypothetical protein
MPVVSSVQTEETGKFSVPNIPSSVDGRSFKDGRMQEFEEKLRIQERDFEKTFQALEQRVKRIIDKRSGLLVLTEAWHKTEGCAAELRRKLTGVSAFVRNAFYDNVATQSFASLSRCLERAQDQLRIEVQTDLEGGREKDEGVAPQRLHELRDIACRISLAELFFAEGDIKHERLVDIIREVFENNESQRKKWLDALAHDHKEIPLRDLRADVLQELSNTITTCTGSVCESSSPLDDQRGVEAILRDGYSQLARIEDEMRKLLVGAAETFDHLQEKLVRI